MYTFLNKIALSLVFIAISNAYCASLLHFFIKFSILSSLKFVLFILKSINGIFDIAFSYKCFLFNLLLAFSNSIKKKFSI